MPRKTRVAAEQPALIDLPDPPAASAPRGDRAPRPAPSPGEDWQAFLTSLDAMTAHLVHDLDSTMAELQGALVAGLARIAAGGDGRIVSALVTTLAEHPTPAALAQVLAIRPTADEATRPAVDAAVTRLVQAGVPVPPWAEALAEPITAGDLWRWTSLDGEGSMLVGSFQRAGSTHVVVVTVDDHACGEASAIGVVTPEELTELDRLLPGSVQEALDPAQFRWEVESALRIRHEHDTEDGGPDPTDEEAVEYAAGEALVRTRLALLPELDRPLREHPGPAVDLSELVAVTKTRPAGKGRTAPKGTSTPKRTPRKPATGARIYQVKVTLRGYRPPIWRRLEVPANITLHQLHRVLQVAFDWDGTHMHQFVTPVGRFGRADPELDLRADKRATLAEVAPGVKSKIVYEYDFGDSWEHEIVVEKVLDREPAVGYPRCTGGRRAAPPEDCGGVWGYANLVEALADPAHPDHEQLVDWMGLVQRGRFDPERFDAEQINRRLAPLR